MNQTLEPQFDKTGVLRRPDLHDGFLNGIQVLKDKQAILSVADIHGVGFNMLLTGVQKLRAQNFCEGNILFDVVMFDLKSCPRKVLEDLYDIEPDGQHAAFLDKLIESKPDFRIIEVSSSYGCYLTVLFHELTISTGS